eukprot:COSAG04_NODE_2768_length_3613_cov_10.557769_1_plen_133_part_00
MPTGAECPFGTQFPPPATNLDTGRPLHGFCESTNTGYQHADCPFAVVDRLVVPADMAEGDWVLSFRWVSRAGGLGCILPKSASKTRASRIASRRRRCGRSAPTSASPPETTSRAPQVLSAAKYVTCLKKVVM